VYPSESEERQLEGIARAKAAGVYKGRPASIDVTKGRELKAQGMGASEIAKVMGIGRASVYRARCDKAATPQCPDGCIVVSPGSIR
jgi:DNA invertase Pin-like site-specific DNA recombinase